VKIWASVDPKNVYEETFVSIFVDDQVRDLHFLVVGMPLFCRFTVFPSSVATSGPYIVRARLASSGVTGQFLIKLLCSILLNSCSEGRPIFLYSARA
jgi:hypothetical protein